MPSLRRTLIELKNIVLRLYYELIAHEPVWGWLNAEPRRLHKEGSLPMNEVQASIVRDLVRTGIALSDLDSLFPGMDMLGRMRTEARRLEASAVPNIKKTFLTQLIQLKDPLDLDGVFVRFAMSEATMGCVSGYLDMWPKFYFQTLGEARPVDPGAHRHQSQLWHRDPEDRKMCKVFVYLNDVDAGTGPFEYVRHSIVGHRWGHLFKQRPPVGFYPPDGAVEAVIPSQDIATCTGRAGTVIFADTSGLHRGGYATERQRLMLTAGYVTKACTHGVFYSRARDHERKADALGLRVAYALRAKKFQTKDWVY